MANFSAIGRRIHAALVNPRAYTFSFFAAFRRSVRSAAERAVHSSSVPPLPLLPRTRIISILLPITPRPTRPNMRFYHHQSDRTLYHLQKTRNRPHAPYTRYRQQNGQQTRRTRGRTGNQRLALPRLRKARMRMLRLRRYQLQRSRGRRLSHKDLKAPRVKFLMATIIAFQVRLMQ